MIRRSSIALLGLVLGLLVWQGKIPPPASAATAVPGGSVADLRPASSLSLADALPLGVLLAGGALIAAFCSLRLLRAGSMARVIVLGFVPALLLASGYLLITGGEPNRRLGVPTAAQAVGTRPPARLSASPIAAALAGRLIYAVEGRLWSLDPNGGGPVDLTPNRSRDTMAGDPALSPDGTTLAYTLLALPTLGQDGRATVAPGSDLYLLNLRSGEQRRVLEHDRPATLIESLNWTRDGHALIFASTSPILAPSGALIGVAREIQRLDLASGQRATLIADAFSPALSPDGAQLAYVASDSRTFETSLCLANADGSARRQLVGTAGGFADFLAPRFSPDGQQIAFSVAGGPGVEPPSPSPPTGGAPARFLRWFLAPLIPQQVAAHGLPGDLWLVGRDGGGLQRLTALYEDQPIPAWSPDGRWIAILAGGGIYFVRTDGAELARRSGAGGSGSLIWVAGWPRP